MKPNINPKNMNKLAIWLLQILIFTCASSIIIYNVPSYSTILIIACLIETILIGKIMDFNKRIKNVTKPPTQIETRDRTIISLRDIESET